MPKEIFETCNSTTSTAASPTLSPTKCKEGTEMVKIEAPSKEVKITEMAQSEAKSSWRVIRESKELMVNLICMMMVWISASFCFFLISFQLKYIEGDIYVNSIVSSTSEMVAYGLSGALMKLLGIKLNLAISYILAILGMVCFIAIPTQDQLWLSIFVMGSKFGISSAFNIAFLGNKLLFPTSSVATSYGICNTFARTLTIFAPFVAELKPEAISEWTFLTVCGLALLASLSIIAPKEEPRADQMVPNHHP
jgi:hypothetical protein